MPNRRHHVAIGDGQEVASGRDVAERTWTCLRFGRQHVRADKRVIDTSRAAVQFGITAIGTRLIPSQIAA